MKKNLLLPVMTLAVFTFTSCMAVAETIKPSKNYVTKKVEVKSFEGISAATSINVLYTQTSGSQDIEIYAPDNLMEYVKVAVENGVLKVKFESKKNPHNGININGKHETEVRVSAPAVHTFRASSSGDVILKNGLQTTGQVTMKSSSSGDIVLGTVECKSLEADASSSGDVNIKDLKAEIVEADASSSGDVILSGECRSANLSASSSGDINAKHLKADKVVAGASSAGDVTCHAVESLTASTSSSGNVNYKGNPKHIDYHPKKGLNKIED